MKYCVFPGSVGSALKKLRVFILIFLYANAASAQAVKTQALSRLDEIKIAAPSLAGNLLGDPTEQRVAVYLPPGYDSTTEKRYPVLYILHGYTGKVEEWTKNGYQGMSLQPVMDELISKGVTRQMIVVVPNGGNAYFGSFYTNSPTTGNWEDYVFHDLVGYIDSHYKTIANAASRGIAGHSMGGYGSIMIGMKHPHIFGAIYALSPCCIGLEGDISGDNPVWAKAIKTTSRTGFSKKPESFDEFWIDAMIATSAAFSPDAEKGPLFVSFPFKELNGKLVPSEPAFSAYRAKMPLYLINQYEENLKKLRGIAIDVGEVDDFSHIRFTTHEFSEALSARGIPHLFEIYKGGDHGNKIRERFERRVVPFFSEMLEFK